ncbi:uncharacterized protein LOC131207039 [Anopheles bellator]|uniref:uncharacterized protein LOC131207039 n=1 Tax=Anopheles bellator TaxID=139047 RepID=UPI002648EC09|nr:uncharacterized protein LOC131207039 [Anopheles bellator]
MENRQAPNNEEEQIIFLKIIQGIRFNQDKPARKIALVASLDHTTLNAVSRRPITPGGGSASFNSSIVWTCDRISVKRMKMSNQPIKLDCYETHPDGQRFLIGCVVIPLRSVSVVTLARARQLQPRWYRLIGIESERWRRQKPELQLLVMVTDSRYLQTEDSSSATDDLSEERQRTTIFANPDVAQLPGAVELLEDRGLLQVGQRSTDTDLFLLEIVLKYGRHLDRLAKDLDTFHLRYQLLGDHYSPHAERKDPGSAVFVVQEKISIHLRSSLIALASFFQDALKIRVDVLREGSEGVEAIPTGMSTIGSTTIDFVNFLHGKSMQMFEEKDTLVAEGNFPILPSDRPVSEQSGDRGAEEYLTEASLKCKISLRFLGCDNRPATGDSVKTEGGKAVTNEADEIETVSYTMNVTKSVPELHRRQEFKAPSEKQEKIDIDTILLTSEQDLRDIRRTFAFSVTVESVQFNINPSPGMWQLTLQHPKGDTPFTRLVLELLPGAITPSYQVDFGGVALKLLFSTLPDQMVTTIGCEPSKLTLNGPHGLHGFAWLDNGSLLVGTREKQPSGVVVLVNDAGESVAIATVTCSLEEVGLNYNSQLRYDSVPKPSSSLPTCHHSASRSVPFDETIAYYLLEEQKEWMRKERDRFLEELREKELKHLESLTRDWKAKQATDEQFLAERLAYADTLAKSLEEARRKTLDSRTPHTARIEQIEQQFQRQLSAIRAQALRLQREAECHIDATRKQCLELQEQSAEQTFQQQQLLERNRMLQAELDDEREARSKEEADLRRTLEDVAQSKAYYKQQWAKQTRELHQLRQELAVCRTPYHQTSSLVTRPKKPSARKPPTHSSGYGR